MQSNETTFPRYQAYRASTVTRPVKKETALLSLLFRYTLPFILLDSLAVGVASFLYAVQTGIIPVFGAVFFLYSTICVLLVAAKLGFGEWYSRSFILLYILLVGGLLGLLVVVILIGLEVIYIFGFIGAGVFIFITNVILLPVIHIGAVLGKWILSPERFSKTFQGFINTGRMDPRELLVNFSCSLALVLTFGYATFIEPNSLRVEEVQIVSDKVTEDVTILHLSDLQITSVGRYERKVFQRIQQLNPDLIVHTGDLIQYGHHGKRLRELKKLRALFQQLTPKYGIYNVVGNHDWHLQRSNWFEEFTEVKTLVNDEWLIDANAGQIRLFGLSVSTSWRGDKALIEAWRHNAGDDEFTIVMGHLPDYIVDIVDLDIDLCLAGHLHGGQVRIPWLGPLILEKVLQTIGRTHIPREWMRGYQEVGNTRINISAGVGIEHMGELPTIRFNCPPTMTLFSVKPS